MTDLAYDDRTPYMPPGGAPKPPPELWTRLEQAGRDGDDYAFALAHAEYMSWLHDQGIEGHPDPLHGRPPTEPTEDRDDEEVPW